MRRTILCTNRKAFRSMPLDPQPVGKRAVPPSDEKVGQHVDSRTPVIRMFLDDFHSTRIRQPVLTCYSKTTSTIRFSTTSGRSSDDQLPSLDQLNLSQPGNSRTAGTAQRAQFPYTGEDPATKVETRWGLSFLGSVDEPGGASQRRVNLTRIRGGHGAAQPSVQRGYGISSNPNDDYRPGQVSLA